MKTRVKVSASAANGWAGRTVGLDTLEELCAGIVMEVGEGRLGEDEEVLRKLKVGDGQDDVVGHRGCGCRGRGGEQVQTRHDRPTRQCDGRLHTRDASPSFTLLVLASAYSDPLTPLCLSTPAMSSKEDLLKQAEALASSNPLQAEALYKEIISTHKYNRSIAVRLTSAMYAATPINQHAAVEERQWDLRHQENALVKLAELYRDQK